MEFFKTLVLNGLNHELPREQSACEYLNAWVEPSREDKIMEMRDNGASEEEIAAIPVDYFVQLVYIELKPNGDKRLCNSNEGSEEIVEFFKLVANGEELHQRLTVGHEGNKSFFKEYHVTKQEACDYICSKLGI